LPDFDLSSPFTFHLSQLSNLLMSIASLEGRVAVPSHSV
jgi:hypothetical protein